MLLRPNTRLFALVLCCACFAFATPPQAQAKRPTDLTNWSFIELSRPKVQMRFNVTYPLLREKRCGFSVHLRAGKQILSQKNFRHLSTLIKVTMGNRTELKAVFPINGKPGLQYHFGKRILYMTYITIKTVKHKTLAEAVNAAFPARNKGTSPQAILTAINCNARWQSPAHIKEKKTAPAKLPTKTGK